MDMEVSECVRKALHEYVDPGVSGYVRVILDKFWMKFIRIWYAGKTDVSPCFFLSNFNRDNRTEFH